MAGDEVALIRSELAATRLRGTCAPALSPTKNASTAIEWCPSQRIVLEDAQLGARRKGSGLNSRRLRKAEKEQLRGWRPMPKLDSLAAAPLLAG